MNTNIDISEHNSKEKSSSRPLSAVPSKKKLKVQLPEPTEDLE